MVRGGTQRRPALACPRGLGPGWRAGGTAEGLARATGTQRNAATPEPARIRWHRSESKAKLWRVEGRRGVWGGCQPALSRHLGCAVGGARRRPQVKRISGGDETALRCSYIVTVTSAWEALRATDDMVPPGGGCSARCERRRHNNGLAVTRSSKGSTVFTLLSTAGEGGWSDRKQLAPTVHGVSVTR